MTVNFDSDKVLFILFYGGSCGSMLARLLSLSEDGVISTNSKTDPYDFITDASNNNIITGHGWCNNSDLWKTRLPEKMTVEESKIQIEKLATPFFVEQLKKNKNLIMIRAHCLAEIYNVFSKAKKIFIDCSSETDKIFTLRAVHMKNEYLIPEKLNEKTSTEIRTYLHQYYKTQWFDATRIYGKDVPGDYFKLPLYKLLNKDRKEYERLCTYLKITPSDEYEKFVDAYMTGQWKRKDKK